MEHSISLDWLTIEFANKIIYPNSKLSCSPEVENAVKTCRAYLDKKVAEDKTPVYGITTGFGSLCNQNIPADDLSTLQRNLVISHACGFGDEVPEDIVKTMLLLKIKSLSYGHSGVQWETIQRLVQFFNHGITPVIYTQGSLGASGDLAPLAHLSLPLLGLGKVRWQGNRYESREINEKFGWEPLELQSKEGLALLNGTQFMGAYGVWCCGQALRLFYWANIISAISLDAFDGLIAPFHPLIYKVRGHKGQQVVADLFNKLLQGSGLCHRAKAHVQDPYSFRCIPQVHGAIYDTISHARKVIEQEINSVTDNPTIFPEEDLILSAGNFHGEPLALVMDFLAMAVSELGNISERRIYQLISGKRGLPPFLVQNPGLNSGFMIPQYTAASIVNQNKLLANPCCTDSIESSQGQEDHVSMGANSATKLYTIVKNTEKILSIELLNAAQAIDFRRPLRTSPYIENLLETYRAHVPFVENDVEMHELMRTSQHFIHLYDNKEGIEK
ncbi:MAG: histidine ammonia-lyase [Bacteroidales bacterium]|nr:histidine ammonia-lyase [Bacteroidales bacterium]